MDPQPRTLLGAFPHQRFHETGGALEVGHGDMLLRRVEGRHAHAERHGAHAAGRQDVRVGAAAVVADPIDPIILQETVADVLRGAK